MRSGSVKRKTRETNINLTVNLDGKGNTDIDCELGFFSHMLESLACHGQFDIKASLKGDLHVGSHHLVEDTGIALGTAIREALGDKKGIQRAGFFFFPMDETLAMAAIDLSGRAFFCCDFEPETEKVGDFPCDLVFDFFGALSSSLGAAIHLRILYGRSDHHKIEALFKALARALQMACSFTDNPGSIPSTKGVL